MKIFRYIIYMSYSTILFAVFCVFGLQLSVSDMKTKSVFRCVIVADAIFLSVLRFAEFFTAQEIYLLIFELAEFLVFPLLAFLFMRFVKSVTRGGLGEGDVLFSIPCGIFCGKNILFGLFLSAALAAVFFARRMAEKIPFIPFMCVGAVAAYFF